MHPRRSRVHGPSGLEDPAAGSRADSALRGRSDGLRVLGEHTLRARHRRHLPAVGPAREFLLAHADVERAPLHVERDRVAVADERNGPAVRGLGATCPMHRPVVPPENRPSVSSSTSLPSPAPLIAPVTASISRIPGPPRGPSPRITTTSPGCSEPSASMAACSPSNTLAVPSNRAESKPALFTTAPS